MFQSEVKEIVHMGDKVRVSLNGALPICAEIGADVLDELKVETGDMVYASLKMSAIRTYR